MWNYVNKIKEAEKEIEFEMLCCGGGGCPDNDDPHSDPNWHPCNID